MENVKYIPGDLVRSNNNPKIIWKVKDVSQDKRGNVLYRLIAVEEEEAFIYLYEPQIAPIPLTPAILEANGWNQTKHIVEKDWYEYYKYENCNQSLPELEYYPRNDCREKESFSAFWGDTEIRPDIHYLHELQHLLFGLGLDSSLKV